MTKLKPCPFCGGDNVILDVFGPAQFAASCEAEGCMVIGPERENREEAVAAWNAELKRPARRERTRTGAGMR